VSAAWTKQDPKIHTRIISARIGTVNRQIAQRVDGRKGSWRVDIKTSSYEPWEAIDGGIGFNTTAVAKAYAKAWAEAAMRQESLSPSTRDIIAKYRGAGKAKVGKKDRVCLVSGYGYELDGDPDSWKSARVDAWDIVMIDGGPATVLGSKQIDGAKCVVAKRGQKVYAQTAMHVQKC